MKINSIKYKNSFYYAGSFSEYVEKYSDAYTTAVKAEKILVKFSFSLVFVILMWISANSFVYLPFTLLPVTMQVFTVLFCAITLGKTWALLSQLEYLLLGLAGLPLFAGFKSGAAVLLGPTGGYIIGFAAAGFVTGFVYKKLSAKIGGSGFDVFIACLCGLAVIYVTGYIHLTGFLYLNSSMPGVSRLLLNTFKAGVLPFIIFDLIKIMAIVSIHKTSGRNRQAI